MAAVYYETVACAENGITNEKGQKGEEEKRNTASSLLLRDVTGTLQAKSTACMLTR